jgi:hypothetical protein
MSNFLAIGGVSNTLRTLLLDRMKPPPDITVPIPVTIGTPHSLTINNTPEDPRINLFLYKIEENPNLKNQEIPGLGHPASYGNPPLSLNLFYLVTVYGSTAVSDTNLTNETRAQQLLGSCMQVFHDWPIITNEMRTSSSLPVLDPNLLNEFEKIKITLEPVSLEDISKIWSSLSVPLRLSVAYRISVVQIESGQIRHIVRPVQKRRIHLSTLKRPEITDLYRTPAMDEPAGDTRATIGQELTIEGKNFLAPRTWVKIGNLEPIGISPLSDSIIRIAIPGNQYPIDPDHPATRNIPGKDRLKPGPQVVEVLIRKDTEVIEGGLDQGRVVEDQRKQGSNLFVFMFVPEIGGISPNSGDSTQTLLTVNGNNLYYKNSKSYVIVGDVAIEVQVPGLGDSWNEPTLTRVQVPLDKFLETTESLDNGNYDFPVRVMVNGAQSIITKTYTYTKH